jgi:hypothetical protein
MIFLCLFIAGTGILTDAKEYIVSPEVITWVEELSTKEITSGVRRAKELLKSTKKLEVDEKDQRYVNNQLYGLEHRLDNAINKMEELGMISQEENMKMKRGKQDHDSFQKKLAENLEILELQDKKLAGSLKRISKQMAVGLMNVEYNIQQIANATGLVKQTNRVESHIEHLVVSVEVALETFVEILDRADSNLVSRNVMTRQDLLQMNVKSNDIYHSLRPLFSNNDVEKYFTIPIATTAYWPKDEKFVTYLHLPQFRESDRFQSVEMYPSFVLLKSEKWQTQLLHSQVENCINTKSSNVCGTRICKVSTRSTEIIHSCMLHEEKSVEIIFNATSNYQSSPIEILCLGEKKKLVLVKDQIVSIDLPQHCEAFNEYFKIERVLTAKLKPRSLGVKSFSVTSFRMKDVNRDHLKIRNSATHKVIKNLLKESKNNEEMEKNIQAREIVTIVGSSGGALFGISFIVCCIYAFVNYKK